MRLVAAALKAQPRSPDVLSNYGVILDALKRHEEALENFDKVLALRGNDAVAHYNRGNALKGLGRSTAALASYDRALALKPDYVDALYNRGNTLTVLRRHQDALADYDKVLALRPRHLRRSIGAATRSSRWIGPTKRWRPMTRRCRSRRTTPRR